MGVRPDVEPLAGEEGRRSHLVEEYERPDHLPAAVRQRAANGEAVAEVAHPRHDDEVEEVAGFGVARDRVLVRQPAHDRFSLALALFT